MSQLEVAGIDWATETGDRALVTLRCNEGRITLVGVQSSLSDTDMDEVFSAAYSSITVDVPFGWPTDFSNFVKEWHSCCFTECLPPARESFMYRTTDLVVLKEILTRALSVSSDKITLSARM